MGGLPISTLGILGLPDNLNWRAVRSFLVFISLMVQLAKMSWAFF